MKLAGMRAMNWLRLEKTYRGWGTELSKEVTAFETGLDRFIRLDKNGAFVGREALEKQKASGTLDWRLVTLLIDGQGDADPWGVESLWSKGKKVGRCTGGGYSVHFKTQIAVAYVRPEFSEPGQELTIKMLGEHYPATVVEESPYDPTMRSCGWMPSEKQPLPLAGEERVGGRAELRFQREVRAARSPT